MNFSYQNGTNVEIFNPSSKDALSIWKSTNVNSIKKDYDKFVRGYILILDGNSQNKIQLPKDEKKGLSLTQPFLVCQVCVPSDGNLFLEIAFCDINKTRRRLILSTNFRELIVNPLHAQIPLTILRRDIWINLSIDVESFSISCFHQQFKSIETIVLGTICSIRKIFTMKAPLSEASNESGLINDIATELIPRAHEFPIGVSQINQVLGFYNSCNLSSPITSETPDAVLNSSSSRTFINQDSNKASNDMDGLMIRSMMPKSSKIATKPRAVSSTNPIENASTVKRKQLSSAPPVPAPKSQLERTPINISPDLNATGVSALVKKSSVSSAKNKSLPSKIPSSRSRSEIPIVNLSLLDKNSGNIPKMNGSFQQPSKLNINDAEMQLESELKTRKQRLADLEKSYNNNFGNTESTDHDYLDIEENIESQISPSHRFSESHDEVLYDEASDTKVEFNLDSITRPMSSQTLQAFQDVFYNYVL